MQKNYGESLNPNCKVLKGFWGHLYYFNNCFSRCIRSSSL